MVIFHSYVSLPEGNFFHYHPTISPSHSAPWTHGPGQGLTERHYAFRARDQLRKVLGELKEYMKLGLENLWLYDGL
jgi:hypothetical protein